MSSRTINSTRNLTVAIIGQGISTLLTFISRTAFIYTLGSEYLGINGLFSNILTFLNLAELGVSNAITFSLYKPLLENDEDQINSIMYMYKWFYRIIGLFIIIVGCFMTPFIDFFITSDNNFEYLNIYFILYVLNTGCSYFFSYKRTLISADQKQYINTVYQYIFLIIQNILQLIFLFLVKSYIVYLVIQILFTFFQNLVISKKADNLYPYLKNNKKGISIEKNVLKTILRNSKAMFYHKIGSAVVNSTDNIIISKFINISVVGIYSNYSLVLGALNQLLGQFFSAISASVGNLGAENKEEPMKNTFDKVFFLNYWMYSVTTVCCACLFQPFITLWVGKEFLLEMPTLIVVLFNYYINGMRKCVLTFRESLGLYWYDRYKPLFEAGINLIVSIILVNKMGLIGVFIATSISCLSTSLWVEPYVLCKYGFHNKLLTLKGYFIKLIKYSLITILNMFLCLNVCNFIAMTGIIGFIIKCLIVFILSNLFIVILFYKTKEFVYLRNVIFLIIKKILKRSIR